MAYIQRGREPELPQHDWKEEEPEGRDLSRMTCTPLKNISSQHSAAVLWTDMRGNAPLRWAPDLGGESDGTPKWQRLTSNPYALETRGQITGMELFPESSDLQEFLMGLII